MSIFIKNIEEIQEAGLPIDLNTDLEVLDRHLIDSENNFVKPVLGEGLFEAVKAGLEEATVLAKWTELLPYLQTPVAHNGYYRFFKFPGGQINHRGYHRDRSDHSEHAPKWEKDQLRETLICQADFALDLLIAFLEENKSTYPEWEASDYFKKNVGLIVPTASIFNQFVNISCSGRVFHSLFQFRIWAERSLVRLICKPMMERIQTELKSELGPSAEVLELIDYLRPVVVYDTMMRGIKKMNFTYTDNGIYSFTYNDGTLVKKSISMSEAKELAIEWERDYTDSRDEVISFLKQHIDDYPEYAESPCYLTEPKNLVVKYDNDILNKHFGI